jgi:hypothetical protein
LFLKTDYENYLEPQNFDWMDAVVCWFAPHFPTVFSGAMGNIDNSTRYITIDNSIGTHYSYHY